jgi:hypothetical protein
MSCLHLNRNLPGLIARAIVLIAAATPIAGQDRRTEPPRPEYLIEFHTPEGCFFSPIVGPANRGLFSYALPRPGTYLPDRSGQPILSSLSVRGERVGDFWELKVFLGAGEFYDAGSRQVGAFTLSTNERAAVNEAAQLGLGSFRVAVVKVIGQGALQPAIRFKTQSLSLDKFEVNTLPEPHRVFLKNNSDKDVLAIQYNTYRDRQMVQLKWLSPPPPRSLIKTGEVFPMAVLSEDRTCADSDGYHSTQSNVVEIASVVFVDGTYEGDSGLAALVRGGAMGNKKNLDRVISVLGDPGGNKEATPELLMSELKALAEGMDEEADPELVQVLKNGLPPQSDNATTALTNFIRSGQHTVQASLLRDAQQLETLIKRQNTEAARAFSAKTITKYQQWHAWAAAVAPH